MAIRLDNSERLLKNGRNKSNRKSRILVSGNRKPRIDVELQYTFISERSKLENSCARCGKSFDAVERKIIKSRKRIKRTNSCIDCWKQAAITNNARRRNKWDSFKKLYILRAGDVVSVNC